MANIDVDFKSGDKVVYPAHGVGEVIGQEVQEIAGTEIQLYVISFDKDKMVLRVPVKRAVASGLRALSTDKLLAQALTILKGKAKPGRGMWSRRAQEYENKINSGDVTAIAEVVRDLYKNVEDPDRSYSERIIYESALERMAGEFAAVESVTEEVVIEKIIAVLKTRKSSISGAEKDASVLEAA